MHLRPALYPFLANNAGISLMLELDGRRVDAYADGFDAVIRHGAIRDSRLVALTLAKQALPRHFAGIPAAQWPAGVARRSRKRRAVYYLNRSVAD